MKTYPDHLHIQIGQVHLNTTNNETLRTILERTFSAISRVAEADYVGYARLGNGKSPTAFDGLFIKPNATNETFSKAFSLFVDMMSFQDVDGHVLSFDFPSWASWCPHFLGDPNMGTNTISGSGLLTPEVLTNKSKEIVDLILNNQDYDPEFGFIGRVNPQERANTIQFTTSGRRAQR
ncbi:hypothetical protein EMCG_03403 [[Emmonsia] crescens]|uniref:Uncharacterized protein n=1 Tax=[Emmonsia] crescens TaxID=73230 RepID=A0A0G2J085_9EURO|nr:hypothetical protein EMCG_03403 [Emmonsia crescens UAMH 3008]